MRFYLALLAELIATTSVAATLPIAGNYGTRAACAVQPPYIGDTSHSWLRVTPHDINGLEWDCTFDSVRAEGKTYLVSASCFVEGNIFHRTLIFIEDLKRRTLSFDGMDLSDTLHRCP